MTNGFTKLYHNIIVSSIWTESYPTRIVWVTFLAMSDASGNVIGVSKRLAASANVSICEYDAAISVLSSPDAESKSQENEGRRIIKIPGGWHIVNYAKYRSYRDPEKRKEQNRESQQRCRDKNKRQPNISQRQPKSAQAEAEAEAEADKREGPHKEKYLDFVRLTEEEYRKLIDKLDGAAAEYIERLNEYLGSSGRRYKSHYHTILSWARRDGGKPSVKMRDLPQIFGKVCGRDHCGMPARYVSPGAYGDNYYCIDHITDKTREKLKAQGYNV